MCRALIPLLLIFLTACGPGFRVAKHTAPEFVPYIALFTEYYGVEVKIPLYFNKLEGVYVGVCRKWSDGYREIEIDPDAWDRFSENKRINLIFHELGHCVLNRKHVNIRLEDGCPASFMDEYIISDQCLDKHMDEYIEELR